MKQLSEWKDYLVSESGDIYSFKYNKIRLMKKNVSKKDGYIRIKLYRNNESKTFLLHRLIAESFIPNPENKKEVNHKDGDKLNNIVANLEWATPSENIIHSYKIGLQSKKGLNGEKNGQSKLKETDVINIFNSKENNFCLAKNYNVSFATIYDIKKKRTWSQITNNLCIS